MTKWIEPTPVHIPEQMLQVASAAGFHPLVAELLVRRGITKAVEARAFLDPVFYTPAPPEVLPDLPVAVERLRQAVERGERIAIWGDFDADGQTATALYFQALKDLGAEVTFRIPTRRESHGVNLLGVQHLIDQGLDLLLTADTGIAAHGATALATRHSVDMVITDHHDLPAQLPDALAIVNPKRLEVGHPLSELSGVGVAYQVISVLYEEMGVATSDHLLDLVALGIVADVATLRQDVRYLLQRGLEVLRRTERLGLQEMIALAELRPELLSEDDIRFALAPRLNAISRVGENRDAGVSGDGAASDGVELLTTDDRTRARTIATSLEALNARRKWLTQQTLEAALAALERDRSLLDGPATVIASASWDPGIVGIVAGQLAERFNRPAVVLSAPPGEIARGSARSVEGVDIHAAIAVQGHLLYRCGGHPMAAGLSIESERIDEFRRALWRTLEQTGSLPAEREISIDAYLPLDRAVVDVARDVQSLSPFGPGNEAPVFVARDLTLVSSAIIGRTREHRRLVVRDARQQEETVMWWRSADQAAPEGTFDLAYTIGLSHFRGQENVQLTWVDARVMDRPAIPTVSERLLAVTDYRYHQAPELALQALWDSCVPKGAKSLVVWSEGGTDKDIPSCDRTELSEADTLVIWTTPPGPTVLRDALEGVSPKNVVLVGIDPGLDTPQAFMRRLVGLVKHALGRYGGRVALSTLAAAMAHEEWVVRLGLEWLEQQGQLAVELEDGWISLCQGQGQTGQRLHIIQGQLLAQLQETAAYRAYFMQADAKRLVSP